MLNISKHRFTGANVEHTKTIKQGRVINPVGIVLHYTVGYGQKGSVNSLAHSKVKSSAHIDIARDGHIVQIVPFNIKSWHAGPSRYLGYRGLNSYFIGIEQDNMGPVRYFGKPSWSNGAPIWYDAYDNYITADGRVLSESSRKQVYQFETGPQDWLKQKHPIHGSMDLWWETYPIALLEFLALKTTSCLAIANSF